MMSSQYHFCLWAHDMSCSQASMGLNTSSSLWSEKAKALFSHFTLFTMTVLLPISSCSLQLDADVTLCQIRISACKAHAHLSIFLLTLVKVLDSSRCHSTTAASSLGLWLFVRRGSRSPVAVRKFEGRGHWPLLLCTSLDTSPTQ